MVTWKQEKRNKELKKMYEEIMQKKDKPKPTENTKLLNHGEQFQAFKNHNRKCKECNESVCFGIDGKWLCPYCPHLPDNLKNLKKKPHHLVRGKS